MSINEDRKKEIDKKIESECLDSIEHTGVPIDVVTIARKQGFTVQRLNMDKDTTGMLLCSEGSKVSGLDTKKLIVIKKGLSEEQSRLILSHELGHYILFSEGAPYVAHRKYSHLKISSKEQEADYFARALLMPKKVLLSFIKKLKSKGYDADSIIQQIAKKFKVSDAKAKIRYFELVLEGNDEDEKNNKKSVYQN